MIVLYLLAMLWCHVIDDYVLQTTPLANMKQKSWWAEKTDDPLYRHDYLAALLCHAFSWTFSIHVPLIVYLILHDLKLNIILFLIVFIVDFIVHAVTDNAKANWKIINLVQDQLIHVIQVVITWIVFFAFVV